MGFMYNFNFMGRALLFGNIKMVNFGIIYTGGRSTPSRINGLVGDSLGQSDNSTVNGIAAFTETTSLSIVQANTPEDACANPPNSISTDRGGEITNDSLLFNNASGFYQSSFANLYFRSDAAIPFYQMSNSVDGNGYFTLSYVQDCRG